MNRVFDALLLSGSQQLSFRLRNRVADYVVSRRVADGGYPERLGGSDPYYTDFALRILSLTRPDEVRYPATLAYAQRDDGIRDIPECLNRLSIADLCGVALPQTAVDCLDGHRLASGCFCRSADSFTPSAYCTFLGAICEDMLGLDRPDSMDSFEAILKLQLPGGGFRDTESDDSPQTNSTSAAVGYLLRESLLGSRGTPSGASRFAIAIDRAAAYLLSMQVKDGGFLAHYKAPYPDLLSTFTALTTLAAIGQIKQVGLRDHVQFVGLIADADGGFRSCVTDPESDIEYTYYGLGCLALIAVATQNLFD
jgi:geranylgeranyl transferase type-2 subunit beta